MTRSIQLIPGSIVTRDLLMEAGYPAHVLHEMAKDEHPVEFFCSDEGGRNCSVCRVDDVIRLTPKYMRRVIPSKNARRSKRRADGRSVSKKSRK